MGKQKKSIDDGIPDIFAEDVQPINTNVDIDDGIPDIIAMGLKKKENGGVPSSISGESLEEDAKPWPLNQQGTVLQDRPAVFDPKGSGYDMANANEPDEDGHYGSINPETNQVLKGEKHPTYQKTVEAEEALGNEIYVGDDGKNYIRKKATKEEFEVFPEEKVAAIRAEVQKEVEQAQEQNVFEKSTTGVRGMGKIMQSGGPLFKQEEAEAQIQAHSKEGEAIYNELKEIVGDTPYEYFTSVEAQKNIKESLMQKYGNFNERGLDEILAIYSQNYKNNTFYEKGMEYYDQKANKGYDNIEKLNKEATVELPPEQKQAKVEEIKKAIISKGMEKALPEIFSEDEEKRAAIIEKVRKSKDVEGGIEKGREEWEKAGFDPDEFDGWLSYETGYRNKGRLATKEDATINAEIEKLRQTPQNQLKEILDRNFVIWQGLEEERKNVISQINQVNSNLASVSTLEAEANPESKQFYEMNRELLAQLNQRLDVISGGTETQSERNVAKQKYEAAARAYYLNSDPEEYKGTSFGDFMRSMAKGFIQDIVPGGGGQKVAQDVMGSTEAELQEGLKAATGEQFKGKEEEGVISMTEGGFDLTDDESKALESTFLEKTAPVYGSMGSTILKFAGSAVLQNALGIAGGLKYLAEGNKLQQFLGFGAKMAIADVEFQVLFNAEPGEGAMFTAGMAGMNKALPFLKIIQGEKWYKQWAKEIAKTDIALTGASNISKFISSTKETILNSKEFQYELEKNFGKDRSEVLDNLMIELITNPIFAMHGIFNKATMGRKASIRNLKGIEKELRRTGFEEEADMAKKYYNEMENNPLAIEVPEATDFSKRQNALVRLRETGKDLEKRGFPDLAKKVNDVMNDVKNDPIDQIYRKAKKAVTGIMEEYDARIEERLQRTGHIKNAIEVVEKNIKLTDELKESIGEEGSRAIDFLKENLTDADRAKLTKLKTLEEKVDFIQEKYGDEIFKNEWRKTKTEPKSKPDQEVKPEVKELPPVEPKEPKDTKPPVEPKKPTESKENAIVDPLSDSETTKRWNTRLETGEKITSDETFNFISSLPEGTIITSGDDLRIVIRKPFTTKKGTIGYELITEGFNEDTNEWVEIPETFEQIQKKVNGEISGKLPSVFYKASERDKDDNVTITEVAIKFPVEPKKPTESKEKPISEEKVEQRTNNKGETFKIGDPMEFEFQGEVSTGNITGFKEDGDIVWVYTDNSDLPTNLDSIRKPQAAESNQEGSTADKVANLAKSNKVVKSTKENKEKSKAWAFQQLDRKQDTFYEKDGKLIDKDIPDEIVDIILSDPAFKDTDIIVLHKGTEREGEMEYLAYEIERGGKKGIAITEKFIEQSLFQAREHGNTDNMEAALKHEAGHNTFKTLTKEQKDKFLKAKGNNKAGAEVSYEAWEKQTGKSQTAASYAEESFADWYAAYMMGNLRDIPQEVIEFFETEIASLESKLDQQTENDFSSVTNELGLTPEQYTTLSENEDDLVSWQQIGLNPEEVEKTVTIGESEIEGQGVISAKEIKSGQVISTEAGDPIPQMQDIDGIPSRTDVGRNINHSNDPNAQMTQDGERYVLTTLKDIQPGEEITVDYRDVHKKFGEMLGEESKPSQETIDGLKDIESTTKSLEEFVSKYVNTDVDKQKHSAWFNLIADIKETEGYIVDVVAEKYHRAKVDGSNPEFVESVENLFKNEVTETKVPTITPEQAEQQGLDPREVPTKTTFSAESKKAEIIENAKRNNDYEILSLLKDNTEFSNQRINAIVKDRIGQPLSVKEVLLAKYPAFDENEINDILNISLDNILSYERSDNATINALPSRFAARLIAELSAKGIDAKDTDKISKYSDVFPELKKELLNEQETNQEPEFEVTGKKEVSSYRLREIEGKVEDKQPLTDEEKKIWDEEQYAPLGFYYDYEGNLKKKSNEKTKQETKTKDSETISTEQKTGQKESDINEGISGEKVKKHRVTVDEHLSEQFEKLDSDKFNDLLNELFEKNAKGDGRSINAITRERTILNKWARRHKEVIREKAIYSTSSGKFHVIKKGKKTIVVDDNGVPVDIKAAGKVITEYRKNHNFDEGAKYSEVMEREGIIPDQADKLSDYIAKYSENPAEILHEMSKVVHFIPTNELDARSNHIAEAMGPIKESSWNTAGDRNHASKEIKRNYFAKKGDVTTTTIDVIAEGASLTFGQEVTPDQVVDFILQYPGGTKTFINQPTNEYQDLDYRFTEVSGIKSSKDLIERYKDWGEDKVKEDDEDFLFSFRSPTEDALTSIKQEKATPEQWKAMLLKNGAKQVELDWMGFDEFTTGKKSLQVGEIQDWIKENKVELEEVVKGDTRDRLLKDIDKAYEIKKQGWVELISQSAERNGADKDKATKHATNIKNAVSSRSRTSVEDTTEDWDFLWKYVQGGRIDINEIHDIEVEHENEQNDVMYNGNVDTKFSDYQTPGGKNYKEWLLTMPNKPVLHEFEAKEIGGTGRWIIWDMTTNKEYKPFGGSTSGTVYDSKDNAEARANQLSKVDQNSDKGFKSPHFDEPNIVVHTRTNERTDADGNRVLHIEEFQSDWAQEGKKEGFIRPVDNSGYKAKNLNNGFYDIYKDGVKVGATFDKVMTKEEFGFNPDENPFNISSGVPNTPFKKTPQWVGLALKRMVQYAAENGFDKVTWTTGEQQADRYDLSKQVDKISWAKNSNGTYSLMLFPWGAKEIPIQEIDVDKMELTVGKEVTQKIINNSKKESLGILQNQNLKVGGEGMKAFYDLIVPKIANKLFKKYGAKVEKITVDKGYEGEVLFDIEEPYDNNQMYFFNDRQHKEAMYYFDNLKSYLDSEVPEATSQDINLDEKRLIDKGYVFKYDADGYITKITWKTPEHVKYSNDPSVGDVTFHSITLTPKLIEAANGGFPMFKTSRRPTQKTKQAKWNSDAIKDAKKVAEELGITVTVVKTEANLPALIKAQIKRKKAEGRTTGVYDTKTGKVYIILDNNSSLKGIRETILHEAIGHKGLIAALGEAKYNEVMDAIYKQMTDAEKKKIGGDGYDTKNHKNIAEEYLAQKAPNAKKPNWLKRIIAQIRDWLRKKFKINYSENDINYLLDLSRRALKKNKKAPKGDGEARFSLGGERGLKDINRVRDIAAAEKMEKAGKTVKYIWLRTGMERGTDGEWRWEMDDVTIKKDYAGVNHISEKLSDIVDPDSELLEAYPEMGNLSVLMNIVPDNKNTGSYTPRVNAVDKIVVNASSMANARIILVHEIQHGIQQIEGWAKGGDPTDIDVSDFKAMMIKKLKDKRSELESQLPKIGEEFTDKHEPIIKSIDNINDDIIFIWNTDLAIRAYNHLAGEVEAYNAGRRLSMSKEERRLTPPSETEGIAREDQIVRIYDGVSYSAEEEDVPGFRKSRDAKQNNVTGFKGMELPEYIQLVKKLTKKYPQIKKRLSIPGAAGTFGLAPGMPETAKVSLLQALFSLKGDAEEQDMAAIEMVIAHEIGHLISSFPQAKMNRGNILGQLSASDKIYRDSMLGKDKDNQDILTDDDIKRLKKEAKAQLKEEWQRTAKEIIEEIIETEPIYDDTGLTPDDVLSIWRDVDSRTKYPDLYDYLAGIGSREKAKIMRQAMKGIVNEILNERFKSRIVGHKEVKKTLVRKKKTFKDNPEAIKKRFEELLVEEIRKRELFLEKTIMDELKALTQWWNPFDELASAKFTKYRHNPKELYADAVSVLLNFPEELQKRAPEFYRAFFNWFDVRKDPKAAFEEFQDLALRGQISNTRSKNIREMFEKGEKIRLEKASERREKELNKWHSFLNYVVSRNLAATLKLPSDFSKNNELTDRQVVLNEIEKMAYIHESTMLFLKDVQDGFIKPSVKLGLDLHDLGKLAMYHRNIAPGDRGGFANPLGMQTIFAKEGIKEMIETLGQEKFDQLNEQLAKFHKIFWPYIKEANDAGIFGKEVWDNKIQDTKDTYVTYAVIEYITGTWVTAINKKVKGTLEEIENPIYSTAAKVVALIQLTRRQKAWQALKAAYDEFVPDTIIKLKKTGMLTPKAKKKGNKVLTVYEDGIATYYEVPQYINDMFLNPTMSKEIQWGMTPFLKFKRFFNPLVTTYNPGFWAYSNILRDNSRNVLNLTGVLSGYTDMTPLQLSLMTFREYTPAFFKGVGKAIKYVKGDWDEDIRMLMKEGALFSGYYDRYDFKKGQDLLRPIFIANKLIDKPVAANKWYSPKNLKGFESFLTLMELSQIPKVFGAIRTISTVTEVSSKFAAQQVLKKHLGKDAVAYFVRSYMGTPNGRDKALLTPILDGAMPFYNMIVQSLRTGAELGFNKKSAGAYWIFQAITGAIPGISMALMSALALWLKSKFTDEEIEKDPLKAKAKHYSDLYNKISAYDRLNYLCIIAGETPEGDPLYWRLQLGEEQKLMFSFVQWSAKAILEENTRDFDKLMNIGVGLAPSNSPILSLVGGWAEYAKGRSPVDSHFGSNVIPDVRLRAGLKYSAPYMFKWTMDKVGLRPLSKLVFKNKLREGQINYKINNIPYLRMYKAGGKGETEMYDWVADQMSKKEAEMSVWLQDKTEDAVAERLKDKENPIKDIGDRKELAVDLWEEYMEEFSNEDAPLDRRRVEMLVNSYVDLGKSHRYQNIIQAMVFKSTLKQKSEILLEFSKRTSQEEFDRLFDYMSENGMVTSGLKATFELRKEEFERSGL